MSTSSDSLPNDMPTRSQRDRIGIQISAIDAPTLVQHIVAAEAAGVAQVWMTQGPSVPDALIVFAVALGQTTRIRLGTAIVPTYPRHPLALAQQATTTAAFGTNRLRLGIGPSHRPTIEGAYGIKMETPLAHLEEYVTILRTALWQGPVEYHGRFFNVHATLTGNAQVPVLISALGEQAFRLAGAISDGALSWNCPPHYLSDIALPALRAGAAAAQRPTPPLVAHTWVALSNDTNAIRAAARKRLASYARLPFYANMFAAAGYPIDSSVGVSDALIDHLVVSGEPAMITTRLSDLLDGGFDELLVSPLPINDETSERQHLFELIGQFPD